jgi:hypothetical protein
MSQPLWTAPGFKTYRPLPSPRRLPWIILAAIAILLAAGIAAAFAQQPQPAQATPSQIAASVHTSTNGWVQGILQLDSIIGQWGPAIESLQKQNADLQRDLAAVTKERDELKAKLPPAPANGQ